MRQGHSFAEGVNELAAHAERNGVDLSAVVVRPPMCQDLAGSDPHSNGARVGHVQPPRHKPDGLGLCRDTRWPGLRWSRGLRTVLLGPTAEPERADEELAAEEINGNLVAVIPLPAWSRIRLDRLEHALLVAAERGGPAAVDSLIAQSKDQAPS